MMMNNKALLSTAYLPPVQYFSKLATYDEIWIEAHENYLKQTYRNRCVIYGANGKLALSIPVKKISTKTRIRDIAIDYDTNWQKMHWKSIESAYRSSAFFEFYADDLAPFYHTRYQFLFDFNHDLIMKLAEQLELTIDLSFTDRYYFPGDHPMDDYRGSIHPKQKVNDQDFKVREYFQVFSEKYGFIPNLSILDLLFNTGPEAKEYLVQ
ncbi:MAG: WbqC family protein [Bacteroidales bacterium]|jgi:hypothetical protein|nr:WbqC family protein [Bacteroidales bacterium]